MSFRNNPVSPYLDGKSAVILFMVTLLGFTIESQLTQVGHPGLLISDDSLMTMSSMFRLIYTIVNHSSYCTILFSTVVQCNWPCRLLSYIVHSSLSSIFPLHLLYLSATTNHTISGLLSRLHLVIINHLSSESNSGSSRHGPKSFPKLKLTLLIMALTIGISLPAFLWFAAIPLAP